MYTQRHTCLQLGAGGAGGEGGFACINLISSQPRPCLSPCQRSSPLASRVAGTRWGPSMMSIKQHRQAPQSTSWPPTGCLTGHYRD